MPLTPTPDVEQLRGWARRCETEAATCADPARKAQLEKMRQAFLDLADAEEQLAAQGGGLSKNKPRDRK